MNVGDLSAVMGAVLIIAGIAQVFYQMKIVAGLERDQGRDEAIDRQMGWATQRAVIGITKWGFRTAYPGVLMIVLGGLLLGLGNFLPRSPN